MSLALPCLPRPPSMIITVAMITVGGATWVPELGRVHLGSLPTVLLQALLTTTPQAPRRPL